MIRFICQLLGFHIISNKEVKALRWQLHFLKLEEEGWQNLRNAKYFINKGKIETLKQILNTLDNNNCI
jgi:hypothetical protein